MIEENVFVQNYGRMACCGLPPEECTCVSSLPATNEEGFAPFGLPNDVPEGDADQGDAGHGYEMPPLPSPEQPVDSFAPFHGVDDFGGCCD